MANKKDSSTEEDINNKNDEVLENDVQSNSLDMPEITKTEEEFIPKPSGASSSVTDTADLIPVEDEPELENIEEDDDELDDEEYERIKEELLNEYMQADEEENALKSESSDNLNSNSIPKSDESNIPSQEMSTSSPSTQDSINELMGGSIVTPNKQVSENVDNLSNNIDENIIDDDGKHDSSLDALTPDVDKGISKVAVSKGSSVLIMVGALLFMLYIIYKILQPEPNTDTSPAGQIDANTPIVKPVQDVGQTIVVPEIPKFPEAPKEISAPAPQSMQVPPIPPLMDVSTISTPTPPPAPAVASAPAALVPPPMSLNSETGTPLTGTSAADLGDLDQAAAQKKAQDAARKQSRLKSSIMVANGGGGKKGTGTGQQQDLTKLSRSGNQIAATYIGDLHRIIAQGKVIDAILETAINTDLPGQIRAIVSRDVYSEAGKNILINKGSRLIGSYSANISYGQARVQITWNRIIRPDGVDIAVSSPGIDDIGRAGMGGDVDDHIMRNLTLALMMSTINITLADFADKQSSTSGTTTTTSSTDATTGTSTSSSTANTLTNEQQAYQNAFNTLNKMTNDIIGKSLNMPPTITVNQGEPLKVFVQKDIVFPGASANLARMID